jgi:SulP family sulfate permease
VPVFNEQLPRVTDASRHAVAILVLRGKKDVGSAFLTVLRRYAGLLRQRESKLMLAGVDPYVLDQIERTGSIKLIGRENIFLADDRIGQALRDAIDAADLWIATQPADMPDHKAEKGS